MSKATTQPPAPTTLSSLSWPSYFPDQVAVVWFALDAFTHLSIELLYLVFAMQPGGARKSAHPLSFVWREYGRADNRWDAYLDPEVMAVELPTVLLMGPGALLCVYAILTHKPWRNIAVALVSLVELVGGWYTFAPDWVRVYAGGTTALSTADPYLFWILLVFMNGLWVVVPGILVYDACARITAACDKAKTEARPTAASGLGAYTLIVGLLGAYAVLIPVALLGAKR